jgi:CheY-like chemotaxis protein/sugar-specific transcriptional regulator TrmB
MAANMAQNVFKILIIDDEKAILDVLSGALTQEGFKTETAETAKEALTKARDEVFDVFLIDIKLPDITGVELIKHLQKMWPESIKIMMTGDPSVENAIDSLNKGANSFLIKPFEIADLLKTVRTNLAEREKQEKITGQRVEQWVKLRISRIQSKEYSKFAEETSAMFGVFGVSKTQARIYIALNALGTASASEIAALSKIRREEVYRIMPELENRGIVISKLESPRKFVTVEPKTAVKILIKVKEENMARELEVLNQKKDELISRLVNTSFGIYEEKSIIEAISRLDNIDARISKMTKKVQNKIMLAGSINDLKKILSSISKSGSEATFFQINLRVVVDVNDFEDQIGEYDSLGVLRGLQALASKANCQLALKKVDMQLFSLLVIDEKEALWGDHWSIEQNQKLFWTNDPIQIDILKRAFESLWTESQSQSEDNLSESKLK